MQNFIAQPWDTKTLKDALQAGLERQKTAQFKQDWNLAVTEAVQRISNAVGHHAVCRTAACRRARRCVGNTIPCTLLSERELQSEKMQRLLKGLYVQNPAGAPRRRSGRPAASYDRRRYELQAVDKLSGR